MKEITRADPLQRYLAEVGRYPILTIEQEKKLVARYKKSKDPKAAHQLVTSSLRLVVKIAFEYRNAYHNVLDLIGEGNVGLLKALAAYDPTKGTRFGYYATWWIRAYILKYILDNFRLIKIGTTQAQRKLFFNLMKEKNRMEKMGINPDHKLLSGRLGVKSKELSEMEQRLTQSEVSLDVPRGGEKEGRLPIEMLASVEPGADEKMAQEEFKTNLFQSLKEFGSKLEGREKSIFEERLVAEVPKTLQELADRYGISKERARQLEERIKNNLKLFFDKIGYHIEDIKA